MKILSVNINYLHHFFQNFGHFLVSRKLLTLAYGASIFLLSTYSKLVVQQLHKAILILDEFFLKHDEEKGQIETPPQPTPFAKILLLENQGLLGLKDFWCNNTMD